MNIPTAANQLPTIRTAIRVQAVRIETTNVPLFILPILIHLPLFPLQLAVASHRVRRPMGLR